jgi:hypothetical protein
MSDENPMHDNSDMNQEEEDEESVVDNITVHDNADKTGKRESHN